MDQSNSWVDISISRGPLKGELSKQVGMTVQVKARPALEEFMRELSKGNTIEAEAYSDMWYTPDGGDNKLKVYRIEDGMLQLQSHTYTLSGVAMPLLTNGRQLARDEDDAPQVARRGAPIQQDELVNLSFLRLVGISSEEGVRLGIQGAYSSAYLNKIRRNLMPALTEFLRDYVVPTKIHLHVIEG